MFGLPGFCAKASIYPDTSLTTLKQYLSELSERLSPSLKTSVNPLSNTLIFNFYIAHFFFPIDNLTVRLPKVMGKKKDNNRCLSDLAVKVLHPRKLPIHEQFGMVGHPTTYYLGMKKISLQTLQRIREY